MIARGAMNNPYIFKQITDFLKTGKYKEKPNQFKEYLTLAKKHNISFNSIKNHAMSFTKGIEGGAKLRNNISKCNDLKSLKSLL